MDSISYLGYSLLPILAYLPGTSLLYLISKRLRLNLDSLGILLGGAVLWSYVLIFLASIFEILSLDVRTLFHFFALSGVILLLVLIFFLFLRSPSKIEQNSTFAEIFGRNATKAYIGIAFTIISSITIYSYILNNWDAVFVYLPIAKGILYSGRFLDNPLFPANPTAMAEWPPGQIIIYSWAMQITGEKIRLIPIVYLLMAAVATYGIAKELSLGRHGHLVVLAFFLTFPGVQVLAAHKGLYLDISLIAYAYSALYFLTRALKNGRAIDTVLCGASLSMAALSKEPGVLLIPLVLGILLNSVIKNRLANTILTTVIVSSPFLAHYVLSIRGAMFEFVITHGMIAVAIPVAIALTSWISHSGNRGLRCHHVLYFVLSLLPAAFTYALFNKALLKWLIPNYGISPESQTVLAAFFSATYGDAQSFYAELYMKSIQIYRMFAHGLTAGIFIIPIILGFLFVVYKLKKGSQSSKYAVLMYWLIFLVGIWMYWFNANITSWEFRRLTWVTPLFAILATEGMYSLASRFKSDERIVPFASLLISVIITVYFWVFKARLDWLNVGSPVYGGHIISPMDAAVYSAPVLLSIVVFKRFGMNKKGTDLHHKGYAKFIPFIASIIALSLFFYSFIPQLTTLDPSYYDMLGSHSQPDHEAWAKDVEEFLKTNRIDGAILGSSISAFSYTADVKTVDLRDLVINKLDILKENDTSRLRESLHSMGVEYILAPNENAPLSTYPTWKAALELFPSLSKLMEEDSKIVMKFNAYTLYDIN